MEKIAPPELRPVSPAYVPVPYDFRMVDAYMAQTYPSGGTACAHFIILSRVDQINIVRAAVREFNGMVLPPKEPTPPPEPVLGEMVLLEIDRGYQSNAHGFNDAFPLLPRKVDFMKMKPAAKFKAWVKAREGKPAKEQVPAAEPTLREKLVVLEEVAAAPEPAPMVEEPTPPPQAIVVEEPAPTEPTLLEQLSALKRTTTTSADGTVFVNEPADSSHDYGTRAIR